MFKMTAGEFDLVYNSLSFTLASMMASTLFFWLRLGSVHEKYKSAMTITCATRAILPTPCYGSSAACVRVIAFAVVSSP